MKLIFKFQGCNAAGTMRSKSFVVSACATTTSTSDVIEQRATARWDALLSEDVEAAYEYLSPGYRSSVSYKQYYQVFAAQPGRMDGCKV